MNVVRNDTSGTLARIRFSKRVVLASRARPLHPFQHRVRRMLQRQVDVLADLLAFRHRVQRRVVDRRGIEIEQPNPLETIDGVQFSEQAGEGASLLTVDAVERRVL